MEEKKCSRCQVTKPVADFYKASRLTKSGVVRVQSWCKECSKEYVKAPRSAAAPERRRKCIANGICRNCMSAKATSGKLCSDCSQKMLQRFAIYQNYVDYRKHVTSCVVCGFEYSDVHHLDGNHKNNNPSNLVSLCPNHHRLLHLGLLDSMNAP